MKIFIVHIGEVMLCPPVINLMKLLDKINIQYVLVSTESMYYVPNDFSKNDYKVIPFNYERKRGLITKIIELFKIRKTIWNYINSEYTGKDLIWLTSDTALKHVGNKVMKYNYVLQLMELSETLVYHPKFPIKFDVYKIGNKAKAVVVPEYNRAHIIKAWWNLEKKPLILSNKPCQENRIEKNSDVSNERARNVINSLKGKKIILYQGIIHKERPLDKYIYAVDSLGDDYAFVVMSNGKNIYKDINSRNYYFIPFITPPEHLQITSNAFIGVLSYFPVKTGYSILNALYCAPNKTFEYAMFGIPMIGNDNPGLKYIFETNHAGLCVDNFEVESICKAIKQIEKDYEEYSEGARRYYNSVDTTREITEIIKTVKDQICN